MTPKRFILTLDTELFEDLACIAQADNRSAAGHMRHLLQAEVEKRMPLLPFHLDVWQVGETDHVYVGRVPVVEGERGVRSRFGVGRYRATVINKFGQKLSGYAELNYTIREE